MYIYIYIYICNTKLSNTIMQSLNIGGPRRASNKCEEEKRGREVPYSLCSFFLRSVAWTEWGWVPLFEREDIVLVMCCMLTYTQRHVCIFQFKTKTQRVSIQHQSMSCITGVAQEWRFCVRLEIGPKTLELISRDSLLLCGSVSDPVNPVNSWFFSVL